jgi:hypothetical protein
MYYSMRGRLPDESGKERVSHGDLGKRQLPGESGKGAVAV